MTSPEMMNSYCYSTMNTRFPLIIILVLLVCWVGFVTSDKSKESREEECAKSLVRLGSCLSYVVGTADKPTSDCCTDFKQLLKTNKKCLCKIIEDENDPDHTKLNLNVTLALLLPQLCKVQANISQCPELLNLPPDSPDAQIFHQIGQKSTNISTPAARQPNVNVNANPTIVPAVAAGDNGGAYGYGKRLEFCVGLGLFWSFTAFFIM